MSGARDRIGVVSRGYVYLDNAGAGPLPLDTLEAVEKYVAMWYESGEPWIEGLEAVRNSKRLFAEMVRTSVDNIAAVPGLTYGVNIVLSSLKIPRDSNIVVAETNFPTTVYTAHAMRRSGLVSEVRIARPGGGASLEEAVERLIDEKTSLVMIDHVSWINGYRIDLERIVETAHRHGAYVLVDGFHAAGVIPVDVERLGVDFYATGTYKWLMSLHGGGFVYIRKDIMRELETRFSGWFSVRDSPLYRLERYGRDMFREPFDIERLEPADNASVLEWGTWPLVVFVGIEASLRFLLRHDAPGVYESHTRRLVERLHDLLGEIGCEVITPRESMAGIVVFRSRDPYRVSEILARERIIVSARPGVVRVSPHFYNTEEEIEKTIEVLRRTDACRSL